MRQGGNGVTGLRKKNESQSHKLVTSLPRYFQYDATILRKTSSLVKQIIALKTIIFLPFSVFIIFLSLASCESSDNSDLGDSDFRLVFSDGSEIAESDVQFYDSSTHFLFLKNNIAINHSISGFTILVNNDTIFKGIIYSCYLSSLPRETFFISDCFQYGHDIVELGYYPYSYDLRNDTRIINSFKDDNLLRRGLKCTIDSIKAKSFENNSEAICKFTITNYDAVGYYIPDPVKMGELDFNYYTGGLVFQNTDTKVMSFLKWSVSNPDYGTVSMNDFSILPGNSKVSYSFKSSDYYKMEKGFYKATFRFCGLHYNANKFNLSQERGRIWVGNAVSVIDNIIVE